MSRPLLHEPHHDGSELYLVEEPQALGDDVVVRLRVPRERRVDAVALRYTHDGEPRVAGAEVDQETATDTWWRASFRADNPRARYRWLLSGGDVGYAWVNGTGVVGFDVPDADDFVLAVGAGGPDWHLGSVVYEIFPDRFATSGAVREAPDWARPRGWDEAPSRGPSSGRDWFGGDLAGVEARLDHVEALGANVLYLTPVFPAGSTHRYDATSFDRVDPLLGGDRALASLAAAAHARGMRVVGDLTLNHCGDGHEWFRAARENASAPERAFFLFGDHVQHGYETWLGVRSLPKLDHRSDELRRRLTAGRDSVVQRWLRPGEALDGWRIDVANMTGRFRHVDVNHDVARAVRAAVEEALPGGLLVAEHGHDYRDDLWGDGWHGVMNYMGFTRPVWEWLRGDELPAELTAGFLGLPVAVPRLDGPSVAETMRRFRAGVPWPTALHSWTLLDSHDTARFGVVAGSRERHVVGLGLQMTTPGVPMVWAGDELGLGGDWGEDARRPMPWSRPDTWDTDLLGAYRRLVALRRSSRALARGGMRFAHVDADALVYLRETADERVLCVARRRAGEPVRLPLAALGARAVERVATEGVARGDAVVRGGTLTVPGDGPAFRAWRIE